MFLYLEGVANEEILIDFQGLNKGSEIIWEETDSWFRFVEVGGLTHWSSLSVTFAEFITFANQHSCKSYTGCWTSYNGVFFFFTLSDKEVMVNSLKMGRKCSSTPNNGPQLLLNWGCSCRFVRCHKALWCLWCRIIAILNIKLNKYTYTKLNLLGDIGR